MYKRLSYFFLFVTLIYSVSYLAYAAEAPVAMLQSIANQLINKLKAQKVNLKNNPQVVYRLARQIVVPHADLDEMSKRVLPPATWNNASSAQRAKFKKEFTTLLIRTYASALAEYEDQTVTFFPVRGGVQGKTTVRVNSEINRSDGPSINIYYMLLLKGTQWKLYDMTVEGVSLLESFRSQFSDRLSQGNINGLIAELERHNGRGA